MTGMQSLDSDLCAQIVSFLNSEVEGMIVTHELSQGEVVAAHHHPAARELVIVLDGTAEFIVGDSTRTLSPGGNCSLTIPAGVVHSCRSLSPSKYLVVRDKRDDETIWSDAL